MIGNRLAVQLLKPRAQQARTMFGMKFGGANKVTEMQKIANSKPHLHGLLKFFLECS